jgi:hypothetical protein
VTAGREQDQAAAQAQQAGERYADRRAAESERQARETSGSDVEVSQASWEGPAAVTWPKQSQ